MPPFFQRLCCSAIFALGLSANAWAQFGANLPYNSRYEGAPAAATASGSKGEEARFDRMTDLLMEVQLTEDKDLWARIRRGYAMPDLQDSYVTSQETWYANRPEYIGRMTERSRKYLYHIVEELERRHMPTELALLPFIESAFNPQANSSVKAAGMWQFMPATGKYFALKQNVFSDDRRDVQASTRAALDYLQKLYGMFGDWHLALAAYNWGEGSVMRAMNRNLKAGLGTTYSDLSMPNETRNYVPKLQAVKNIVADPVRFAVDLPDIPNHPYFRAVPIDRDMDVEVAAKLAEVDVALFKALNPAAKQSMIVASGTPRILLPWDNADTFNRNLSEHKGPLASYTAWVVPKTMRLADVAQHSGMAEGLLRTLNNIPKGMMVRGGSTLLVERAPNQAASDISQTVADNARVDLAPEITMQKSYIRAGRGETVAQLAERYGVSAASLANWNHVAAGKRLKKGQMLLVMVPTPYGQKAVTPTSRHQFAEAKVKNRCHGKGKKRVCEQAGDENEQGAVSRSKLAQSEKKGEKKSKAHTAVAKNDVPKKAGKASKSTASKSTASKTAANRERKNGKAVAMLDAKPSKKRKD